MSKTDAERSLDIYRNFTRQTELVVAYLSVARQHEHHTRVQVPKLKHAPVHLARQLEEYLHDPDFEVNRRQYMAEQSAKGKSGGSGLAASKPLKAPPKDSSFPEPASNNPFPRANGAKPAESKPEPAKGPDTDLIDFFESIEQNQTTMPVNSQQTGVAANNGLVQQQQQQQQQQQPTGLQFQPTGYPQQQPETTGFSTNPYQQQMQQQPTGNIYQQQQPQPQQLQPTPTGAGFGGFTPQPNFQTQQSFQPGSLGTIPQEGVPSFQNQYQGGPQSLSPPQQPNTLQPMQTGSTNPFRQSMLMTQQTGMQPQPTGLQSPPSSNLSSPGVNTPGNRQSTNPFARSPQGQSPFSSGTNSPFQQQQLPPPPAPLQATPTGTNPFARQASPQAADPARPQTAGGALAPQPTGSTNPFRQSAFVNHNTGLGWQHNQQPIGGGLDQLPTQQVFPRPAQQTPWQQ